MSRMLSNISTLGCQEPNKRHPYPGWILGGYSCFKMQVIVVEG